MESEMQSLRDQAFGKYQDMNHEFSQWHFHPPLSFFLAHKDVLKSRTKSMVDQVDSLRDRYENLEKRRKNEAEGYQADINLLKQKLRHVEQQLIRSAVTKTKGNFNMYLISITSNDDVNLGPSKCVCLF